MTTKFARWEVAATAFDTMPAEVQKKKAPISVEKKIEGLIKENGSLRFELEYDKALVRQILKPTGVS